MLIFAIALGYETKAIPGPPNFTTSLMSFFKICARLPRTAKIVQPARKLERVSVREIIIESLEEFFGVN